MKYTVVWKPEAERRLARLWTESPDRAQVTQAADLIDRVLAHDPGGKGESRSKGRRVLFVPPLAVVFKAEPGDRMVKVLTVWKYE